MGKLLAVLRIILVAICLIVLMIIMVPYHLVIGFSVQTGFRVRSWFCQLCFWIMGVRLEVEGNAIEHQGPFLVVCNHRSLLDPFICARYVYGYFLGKAELSKYPIFGYGARITGAIFVQRDVKSSRLASRDAMVKALSDGYNVLLYPEGTTNGAETTKRLYKGSFEIAADLDVPVIPMVVEYCNKDHYWVDGGIMGKSIEQLSGWKMDMKLWIGEALAKADALDMLEDAQNQMDEQIIKMHEEWGGLTD